MADRSCYYIGIDAGGTRSRLTVWKMENGERTAFQGGPLNICSASQEEIKTTMFDLLEKAIFCAGTLCRGIGIGAAGFSNPRTEPFFREIVREYFPAVPIVIDSDAKAALYGALQGKDGMILIAGTGSICYGQWGTEHFQAGGGGHLIDDGGSGYMIGREILSEVLRSMDGREGPTVLTELLRRDTGINERSELIDFVYSGRNGKKEIAALSPMIMEACRLNDAAANRIIQKAAGELACMVRAVAGKLDHRGLRLALEGSVLKNNFFLKEELIHRIRKMDSHVTCCYALEDASCGAVYMLMKTLREAGS